MDAATRKEQCVTMYLMDKPLATPLKDGCANPASGARPMVAPVPAVGLTGVS